MKPVVFLLFLLLAVIIAPARHSGRVRVQVAAPMVRVLRSPQPPKVVRRVQAKGQPGW